MGLHKVREEEHLGRPPAAARRGSHPAAAAAATAVWPRAEARLVGGGGGKGAGGLQEEPSALAGEELVLGQGAAAVVRVGQGHVGVEAQRQHQPGQGPGVLRLLVVARRPAAAAAAAMATGQLAGERGHIDPLRAAAAAA